MASAVGIMALIPPQQIYTNAYIKHRSHSLEAAARVSRLLADLPVPPLTKSGQPTQSGLAGELAHLVHMAARFDHISASPATIAAARLIASPDYVLAELSSPPASGQDHRDRISRLSALVPGCWSDCPPGWVPIAESLALRLALDMPASVAGQLSIRTFEEGRGHLRLTIDGPDAVEVDVAALWAEEQASVSCVRCGAPRPPQWILRGRLDATCGRHG